VSPREIGLIASSVLAVASAVAFRVAVAMNRRAREYDADPLFAVFAGIGCAVLALFGFAWVLLGARAGGLGDDNHSGSLPSCSFSQSL
jgi:drug/metabolite transporter (DMT)-like permease